jgi:hypothetical protein
MALTLRRQAHALGAAGRAALLDAHRKINKMRHHYWPTLLKRALEAINRCARNALEKRLRLDVRSTVVTAALDATTALAAHVDRAVDFANRDAVHQNTDLVCECLSAIRDDADRNPANAVRLRECLPPSSTPTRPPSSPTSRTGRTPTPTMRPTCALSSLLCALSASHGQAPAH